MVEMFREIGISDGAIRQTPDRYEFTQAEHDAAARWKAEHMRDPDWVAALQSGKMVGPSDNRRDPRRDKMLANIILTGNIKAV